MKTKFLIFGLLFSGYCNLGSTQALSVTATFNPADKTIPYTIKNITTDDILVLNSVDVYHYSTGSYVGCNFFDREDKFLTMELWPLKFDDDPLLTRFMLHANKNLNQDMKINNILQKYPSARKVNVNFYIKYFDVNISGFKNFEKTISFNLY